MNGKILVTVLGLAMAVVAISSFESHPKVEENWIGSISLKARAMPMVVTPSGDKVAIGGNYMAPSNLGSGAFVSVPSFQGILAPRFSNVDYGASIKYNMPDRKNMAVPCDPLTFGKMAQEGFVQNRGNVVPKGSELKYPTDRQIAGTDSQVPGQGRQTFSKEGYCGGGQNFANSVPSGSSSGTGLSSGCESGSCSFAASATPSCGKGGYGMGHDVSGDFSVPPGYTNGNFDEVSDSIPASAENLGSALPIGTMTTMDASGNTEQFVAMNQIMVGQTKSRLFNLGDMIRGDLAISPCQTGWFSVYPNISADLNAGAINVLTGTGGEANTKLMNLLVTASGGSRTTFGGVDLRESLPEYNTMMAGEQVTRLSNAMGDINVTAFP